nr:pentapeptide repeat-containing protein [Leucobacter sp. L43]
MFDSDLESLHISESKLSFVNLRASRLRDVQFEQCVIDELDLAEARAERIAFTGCSVRSLCLDHAQLRDVDLRELDLSSVSGVESMRGTIISFTQAVDLTSAFAQHLGITIAD